MKQKYLIPLALAAVGIYFILKSKKGKVTPVENPIPEPAPSPKIVKKGEIYIVNTQSSPLSLRPTPSTKLTAIGTLAKGSEIQAKPSEVDGWHEVYGNDGVFRGYVSSQYLLKK
jgi:hypothetical protein